MLLASFVLLEGYKCEAKISYMDFETNETISEVMGYTCADHVACCKLSKKDIIEVYPEYKAMIEAMEMKGHMATCATAWEED